MSRFWPRLLKSVLPVALLSGAGGYLFAVAAGAYVADARDDGAALRETLAWRVPIAVAAWGGGITLLFELFRHLWGAKAKPATASPPAPPAPDAEQLLLQLLEQAERAEQERMLAGVTADTPPPVPAGQPAPAA